MMTKNCEIINPFRPGAGHMPPYLAGRHEETNEYLKLLRQDVILENMILTGLRGVGKTVLLETLKPLAFKNKWLWTSTDLSESTSVSEEMLSKRILTDLSLVTSNFPISQYEKQQPGFTGTKIGVQEKLNYNVLLDIFNTTPGLISDKLKSTLQTAWEFLKNFGARGLIFAYDEAQTMSDNANKEQYPLSLLLDVFQSIQRQNIPFMLILTGLPTLFPKLVEARTYAERMFRVVFLDKLNSEDSREAIIKPIENDECPVKLSEKSIDNIINLSGGYPYFIQFICKEVYDLIIQLDGRGEDLSIPVDGIVRKLDTDFFAGRWARATDRQRELLYVIATLENCDSEFTVQEIVEHSKKEIEKGFSNSHVNQMLVTLSNAGLVYKNRHGKYSFAVPLIGKYILRQKENNDVQ